MQANAVVCSSNMRQIGIYLLTYANNNHGVIYPVGPEVPDPKDATHLVFSTLGTNVPPWERWPTLVFDGLAPAPPAPAPPNDYPTDALTAPYTPKIMLCPSEITEHVNFYHTYVLNKHLEEDRCSL